MKSSTMVAGILCCSLGLPATTIAAVKTFNFIDASAPQAAGRMFRDSVASTCATPGPVPAVNPSSPNFSYQLHTFYNNGPARCVTVTINGGNCTGTNFVSINAYARSVTPATRTGTNWLGDGGSSPNPQVTFSFNAPANTPIVFLIDRAAAVGTSGLLACSYTIQSLELDSVPSLDVDGDGQVDALSDGLLIIRYLIGLRGPALIADAVRHGATRTTANEIEAQIQAGYPGQ